MVCIACQRKPARKHSRIDTHIPVCFYCYRTLKTRQRRYAKQGRNHTLEHLIAVKYARRVKGFSRKYWYAKQAIQRALSTPKWVDVHTLAMVYGRCPKGYHVDHIVPINGENVCGLHVPWNLQYLEAKENVRKSNR